MRQMELFDVVGLEVFRCRDKEHWFARVRFNVAARLEQRFDTRDEAMVFVLGYVEGEKL